MTLKLRHRAYRIVNAPPEACRSCALKPENLFSRSRYVYSVKRIDANTYEVVFRWVKLGMERFYIARLRVKASEEGLVYESTRESPLNARFILRVEGEPRGSNSRVVLEAEMRAGLAAGILGRRDYRVFVEELLESLVRRALEEAAETREADKRQRPHCRNCILYDPERSYCYILGLNVGEPGEPPCRGSKYVARLPGVV